MIAAHEKDPSHATNIASLMILSKPLDRQQVERLLVERAPRFKRLRSAVARNKNGTHHLVDLCESPVDACEVFRSVVFERNLPNGTESEISSYVEDVLLTSWRPGLPHWEVSIP